MPRVSVIVPNYNHANYLKDRLNSVFNQSFTDIEVILLDDASNDESIVILKKYASNERVTHFIINEKNSGSPFKQWMKGIELAKGEYIWIAESDDICELNFLEEQVKALEENDIAIGKTLVLFNQKKEEELHHHFHHSYSANYLRPEHFIDYCPIGNVSAVVFKKRLLDNSRSSYTKFDIIGDKYFYFEHFLNKKIFYNLNTISYFRRNTASLSNLSRKDIHYYKKYFKEHVRLLKKISVLVSQEDNKNLLRSLTRRYYKVRNRVRYKDKLSITYLNILFSYMLHKKMIRSN
jgi:glycosyltransferase involved in cell wall biosynthesis